MSKGWPRQGNLPNPSTRYAKRCIYIYSQRKYYWCPQNAYLFLVNFQFVNYYNIEIEIRHFSLLLPIYLTIFRLCFIFCIGFVDWMASFMYCLPYSYCSTNYSDYFTLLKAIANSNSNLFAIASNKSELKRQL